MIFHNSCRSGKAVSCTKEHFELVHFYQIYIGTQNSTALNLKKKTFLNNYLNFFFTHLFRILIQGKFQANELYYYACINDPIVSGSMFLKLFLLKT